MGEAKNTSAGKSAAMSETPERRRRAQFAGKAKRLILESGGDNGKLEVEFGAGNLWYATHKVASADVKEVKKRVPDGSTSLYWLGSSGDRLTNSVTAGGSFRHPSEMR